MMFGRMVSDVMQPEIESLLTTSENYFLPHAVSQG
jgi:hypothetical protein